MTYEYFKFKKISSREIKFVSNMTIEKAMELFQYESNFLKEFIQILRENKYRAYFFEMPGIIDLNQEFEFVLVEAPALIHTQPDIDSFSKYFSKKSIVSFYNLKGDSLLIVPCPKDDPKFYTHLSVFMRKAHIKQILELWKITAKEFLKKFQDVQPLWISTHGLGIHWLHIRLDIFPKYYTYKPYTIF